MDPDPQVAEGQVWSGSDWNWVGKGLVECRVKRRNRAIERVVMIFFSFFFFLWRVRL